MKKFEYIKVGREGLLQRWNQESISAKKLNELGQKGWELVTFTFVGGKLAFGYFKKEAKSPNPQFDDVVINEIIITKGYTPKYRKQK